MKFFPKKQEKQQMKPESEGCLMKNVIYSSVNSLLLFRTLDSFSDKSCDIYFDTSDGVLILKPVYIEIVLALESRIPGLSVRFHPVAQSG
jgi:hypothetical protein